MRRIPSARQVAKIVRRWAAFLLLLCSLVPSLVYRSWIDAQLDTFVVLAATMNIPVLNWIARDATDTPRVEETRIAGEEATVARPGDGERWPAIVFVNGATEQGHLHPDVQRLVRGLARVGFLVVVPELPGLRHGEITLRTLATLVSIARSTADRPDARGHSVGFAGVSVGSSLALAAAEDDALNPRVSAVAGIAPYADLEDVTRLATTGYIRVDGMLERYDHDDFVSLAVARSLAASLPGRADRDRLVAALAPIPDQRADPLGHFRPPRGLGPGGRALLRLLSNHQARAFDRLWSRLPLGLRTAAARLSPISRAGRLTMPVELATSPHDKYFPPTESRRLARASGHIELTLTKTLSHAIPEPSLQSVGDLLRFDGWVVRSLRALR
jgi:pimeloyl-ACP methyl ester carboxylesterase